MSRISSRNGFLCPFAYVIALVLSLAYLYAYAYVLVKTSLYILLEGTRLTHLRCVIHIGLNSSTNFLKILQIIY